MRQPTSIIRSVDSLKNLEFVERGGGTFNLVNKIIVSFFGG